MESRRQIVLAIVPTLIALLILGYALIVSSASPLGNVNRNILYLTTPVSSFTGTVTDVNGAWVTVDRTVTAYSSAKTKGNVTPTPALKHIVYRIETNENTRFEQRSSPLDYQMKTGLPLLQATPSIKSVHKGDVVTVGTRTDLRTLTGGSFMADSMLLPTVNRYVSGTLAKKTISTITVRALSSTGITASDAVLAPQAQEAEQKTYQFAIGPGTKIAVSTAGADPGHPLVTAASWDSLPLNVPVNVYTDKPITDTDITALYVEYASYTPPVIASPTPSPSPVATPSGKLKPTLK